VLAAIERAAASEVQPYLRDVQDTLLLVNEEAAAQRDALGTVLEANMAVLSVEQARIGNRQNATTEQLTILATIFLPLTFITGFFGQNFGWLTGHITTLAAFVIYGIGALVVSLAVLLSWLRRRRPDRDASAAAGNDLQPRSAPRPQAASDHPAGRAGRQHRQAAPADPR
jgi:magnesium transporter